jgi:hypothetical protein
MRENAPLSSLLSSLAPSLPPLSHPFPSFAIPSSLSAVAGVRGSAPAKCFILYMLVGEFKPGHADKTSLLLDGQAQYSTVAILWNYKDYRLAR